MRGKIYSLEAYAQAKMLDHSGWNGLLPRKSTPSDIDMVIDNDGRILLVELSTSTCVWQFLKVGQRRLYENLVKAGGGKIFAALCLIEPQPEKQIDTVKDIVRFSFLGLNREGELMNTPPYEGKRWVEAVQTILKLVEEDTCG